MADGGWAGVDAGSVGLLADHVAASVNSLLGNMVHAAAGQAFLEWTRYRDAGELHRQLVVPEEASDRRTFDATMQCAARIAVTHSISQGAAERIVDTAVALRDRLPKVAECLRDGKLAPRYVRLIVERTDLVTDRDAQQVVDGEIAAALRRRGSWSASRIRDMVDRSVYRVDPDAVRARRKAAVDARGFWTERLDDGMARVEATSTAEKAIQISRRVDALARAVCGNDGRTLAARKSDAHFCLVMGVAWECQCGNDDCDAPTIDDAAPAPRTVPGTGSSMTLHVICDLETVAGDGETPCFLDGYGVISPAHLDDLLAEPGVTIAPIGHRDAPLAPHTPGNPYRPSTALDTVVRARSLYCDVPGCERPAWVCDIDHVREYDHDHPAHGGQTCPGNTGSKCRFHHNLKTHTDFLDDQTIGRDGRIESVIITPEGLTVAGPAFDGTDLFPALKDIRFTAPQNAPPAADNATEPAPTRRRPRLADKHARRQTEREHNRRTRETEEQARATDPANDELPPF
ncbi:HNH endonuclease [Williamsia herbipolensis]|uniref:HNH endonuclease n=1 Tax=Williamsia herbipolensis TaxID=1603258 RepID=A0AAU4JWQ3_9NOCA|nr:DUF222 domain-containing protein [Williamsia herbipolensis]